MIYRFKLFTAKVCKIISIAAFFIIAGVIISVRALDFHSITRQAFSNRIITYNDFKYLTAKIEPKSVSIDEIHKVIIPKKIRVAISNSDFTNIYHDNISVVGENIDVYKGFIVDNWDKLNKIDKVDSYTINSDDLLEGELINLRYNNPVTITNVSRREDGITYEGNIFIYKKPEGLVLVNELDLETYLYHVVPSEMPGSYPIEALKAQAICARSYAVSRILDNIYKGEYYNLLDNTNSQMYNNFNTTDKIKKAVDDTKGMILSCRNNPLTAYYYANSAGLLASPGDVWGGRYEDVYAKGYISKNGSVFSIDLSDNDNFRDYIDNTVDTLENNNAMYRWNLVGNADKVSNTFIDNYNRKQKTNSDNIMFYNRSDKKYVTGFIDLNGSIQDIIVTKRSVSGNVNEVVVLIGDNKIKINGCDLIRSMFFYNSYSITNNYEKTSKMSSIPSGFFYPVVDEMLISFVGGGYGHGVGMSQDGAKDLAEMDWSYKKILKTYYPDATLITCDTSNS